MLKPGGVRTLVISHYTLDKQNAAIREYLADQAFFLAAISLTSDACKLEGVILAEMMVEDKQENGSLIRPFGYTHAPLEKAVTVGQFRFWHPGTPQRM